MSILPVRTPAPVAAALTLAGQPAVPQPLKLPLSARLIRFLQPRDIGQVTWIRVDTPGTYSGVPTVTVTGPGLSGVQAVARMRGNGVRSIAVLQHGQGSTGAVTVSFSGGGETVPATATAFRIDPLSYAQAASATDLVWYYPGGAPAMGNAFLAAGISVQETINGLVDRVASPTAAATSWDGQPVPVAWLMPSERAFGASRRAGYLALKRAEAAALTSGTAAHFDDPVPDLSALRARDTSRTGGPFDSETLAGFNPNYVSVMQGPPASITQDVWNWAIKDWATTTSNWSTNYNTEASWNSFMAHLRAGGVAFHEALRDAYPSAIRYISGNVYNPLFRRDYNGYLVRAFSVGMHETDADAWTTRVAEGTPLDYAQRYTLLWCNGKTVTGGGADWAPHLQPMRNDETYSSTRPQQVTVLLQQYALCWALGGRPLYPCDTYCEPTAAGQQERWFAEPGDGFLTMNTFVATYTFLFDGTVDNGALALLCDVETNDNRAVTSNGILGWAEMCLRNAVPAIMYPLNGGYPRRTDLEAQAIRVIDCSTPSAVTGALSTLPNYRTLAQQPVSSWAQWSVAKLTGTFTDVFVIPRTKPGATVLHIVNMDGVTRAGLTLRVQQWALPSREVSRVRWFEPGLAPQELSAAAGPTGLLLTLPTLSVWAVILIES